MNSRSARIQRHTYTSTTIAPLLSKSYKATHRIPFRRFALQAFLSALVTLILNLLQHYDELSLSGSLSLSVVGLSLVILNDRNICPKTFTYSYCLALTASLTYLHQITTAIGQNHTNGSPGFARTQHVAVHFCLAFFVISELVFWRLYLAVNKYAWSTGEKVIEFIGVATCMQYSPPYARDLSNFGYTGTVRRLDGKASSAWTFGQLGFFWLFHGPLNASHVGGQPQRRNPGGFQVGDDWL